MITIYYKDRQLDKFRTARSLILARMRGIDTSKVITDRSDSYEQDYTF